MTIFDTNPLADLAFDLFELEGSARKAYENERASFTFLHDKQDVIVVSEALFAQVYDYVLRGFKLLNGIPVRVTFGCGPTWIIPINTADYIGDLDQIEWEASGYVIKSETESLTTYDTVGAGQ